MKNQQHQFKQYLITLGAFLSLWACKTTVKEEGAASKPYVYCHVMSSEEKVKKEDENASDRPYQYANQIEYLIDPKTIDKKSDEGRRFSSIANDNNTQVGFCDKAQATHACVMDDSEQKIYIITRYYNFPTDEESEQTKEACRGDGDLFIKL